LNPAEKSDRQPFKEMIRKGVSLIDFNAPWCGPCKAQKPIIDNLAEKYKDRVNIAELDVDENREAAMELGIASIPTLILYKENVEVKRFVGLQAGETLSAAIENILKASTGSSET
jgi:thioredoxin 1